MKGKKLKRIKLGQHGGTVERLSVYESYHRNYVEEQIQSSLMTESAVSCYFFVPNLAVLIHRYFFV